MKPNQDNTDQILDQVISEVRNQQADTAVVAEAAERVWTRLNSEGIGELRPSVKSEPMLSSGPISSCPEWQELLPAYLDGTLTKTRTLLLEDHLSSCLTCRKALRQYKGEGREVTQPAPRRSFHRAVAVTGIAALVLIGFAISRIFSLEDFLPAPAGPRGTVESIEGTLFKVSAQGSLPVEAGAQISEDEELRTARDSGAVLILKDGSRIEVSQRAELSVSESRRGKTIRLQRGSIIVEAAPQREGYLHVTTGDFQVSVKGTTFSVNSGTKGSRVSVIEGQVLVEQGKQSRLLKPGEQFSSRESLSRVPLAREIAWSQKADQHLELARELTHLQRQIAQTLTPGLLYESRLLDLVPENTEVYISMPNLSESLTQVQQIFQQRLEQSPVLQQWWADGGARVEPEINALLERIRRLGDQLGEEMVVTVGRNSEGKLQEPLLMAQVKDPAGFKSILQREVDTINQEAAQGHPVMTIVEDPFARIPGESSGIYLLAMRDVFAASPGIGPLRQLSTSLSTAANPFQSTPMYARLSGLYKDGVGYLLSVNLESFVSQEIESSPAGEHNPLETARSLGLLDVKDLTVERRPSGTGTENRAVLSFGEARRGMLSWLAEPAPIGALDFVSPDANLVAAFVVKDPILLVEDLFQFLQSMNEDAWQKLVEFQLERGINLQQDVAEPLGGEVVMAIDGPVLPTPSWKLILEVYSPARLQQTLEWGLAELNQAAIEAGKPGYEMVVERDGGRVFYSLFSQNAGPEIHYVFSEGYMIVAPSRALLINALKYRQSGYMLVNSPVFSQLLPEDGRANFSGLVFQNAGAVASAFAKYLPRAESDSAAENQKKLEQITADMEPMLIYAYGEPNRITVASTGDTIPGFSLPALLGMGLGSPLEPSPGRVQSNR